MALAHGTAGYPRRGVGQGSAIAIMALIVVPKKPPVCREKPQGPGVRALWGQQWTRLPVGREDSNLRLSAHSGGLRQGGLRGLLEALRHVLEEVEPC
jgi:hypothetical protein